MYSPSPDLLAAGGVRGLFLDNRRGGKNISLLA